MARPAAAPLLGLLFGVSALSAPAAAQDVAAAEALFNRGLADMKASRFDTGCPALEESYRLDPRPGTLFTLAQCEAKRGRFATAVTRYGDYLALFSRLSPDAQTKQNGRDKIAAEKKAELAPQVPELTITLPPDAPRGTVVKRDSTVLSDAALGIPLPIDPGEHVLSTLAPGGTEAELRVTLQAGEKQKVLLPVKAAPAPVPPPVPPPAGTATPVAPLAGTATSAPPPIATPPDTRGSGQRTGAFIAGAVGVAGLALGGVMGGLALAKKGTVSDHCNGPVCDHEGKLAADAGKTFALVSTIGFGVGIAGVGAAVVLFVTAPSAPKQGATVGIRGAW